jgi:antitoxin HicB
MVTSPDFPELTTFGDDRDEALMRAVDALEEAIAARMYDNREIPEPSNGKPVVEVPLRTATKIIAYQNNSNILKDALDAKTKLDA